MTVCQKKEGIPLPSPAYWCDDGDDVEVVVVVAVTVSVTLVIVVEV